MANTSSAKGNPASHRMMNKTAKETRARSWRNTENAKANGTHRTVKNRLKNEALAAEKKKAFGYGKREIRRLISGKREAKNDFEMAIVAASFLGIS